jgi:AraC family transcriptional regulator of arabinose operon
MPAPPAEPHATVRTYVRDAVASMVTAPMPAISRTTRHEANIILSIDATPFHVETSAFTGEAWAAVIKPETQQFVKADERRIARIAVHPIHPQYRRLVKFIREPAKPLPREAFSHLNATLLRAYHEGVDMETANPLIDAIIAVVLAGAPPPRPVDPRILLVMHRIDADINTPFEDLANELGLSPSRLSHLFSNELGISFRNLLHWGRLRLAWELVAWRPEMSLTEIAHVMGYADSSHLSRAFNRNLGLTPTMIRDGGRIEIIGRQAPAGQHMPPDEEMRG